MRHLRISVIVPVYNAERFLSECVGSILEQGGDDFEVILFDDGSGDSSGSLCDQYAQRHPDVIRTFHQPNAGLVSTRRRALAEAQGEYILFVDSDDRLAPGALDAMRTVLSGSSPDIVIFLWSKLRGDGTPLGYELASFFPNEGSVTREQVIGTMARREELNSLCIKLIRRDLFDADADYTQKAAVTLGEDLLQSLPAVLRAERLYYLDRHLYLYRQNESSMTYTHVKGNYTYVTVVRPQLLEAMETLGQDTEDNLTCFFSTTLQRVWLMLESPEALQRDPEMMDMLTVLSGMPFMRRAKRYIKAFPGSVFRRLVLRASLGGRPRLAVAMLRARNRLLGLS